MSKKRRQSNPSRPDAVFMVNNNYGGTGRYVSPAQGRWFCAQWMQEQGNTRDLDRMVNTLVERVDTLLEALYDLKDVVLLKGGSPAAFKQAWYIDDLIRNYEKGRRR